MIANRIVIIVCLTFLFSCKKENNDINKTFIEKEINNHKNFKEINIFSEETFVLKNLSPIIKNVEYIPLETNEDNLIGNIDRIYKSKNHYFILDKSFSKSLYAFDLSGKFQFKIIAKGDGPNEFRNISAVSITNDKIYISDQNINKILTYDFNGDFIESKRFQYYFNDFVSVKNDKIFLLTGTNNFIDTEKTKAINKNLIELSQSNLSIESTYFEHSIYRDSSKKVKAISESENGNYIISPFFDSKIYELNTESITTKYNIDFGDYALDLKKLDNLKSYEDIGRVFVTNPNSAYLIDNLIESESWLHFTYKTNAEKYGPGVKYSSPHIFYNKTSNKTYRIDDLVKSNDVSNTLLYQFLNIDNNKIITFVTAEEILNKEIDIPQIQDINSGDNPVLVLYSLK